MQNFINTLVLFFKIRSSLYYWAHYDFFNNTHYGEPVAGTRCDEVIASWRSARGFLRSPPNTLVYKRPDQDVSCLYRFVTDRRLFARVILSITNINFKVSLFYYNTSRNLSELYLNNMQF